MTDKAKRRIHKFNFEDNMKSGDKAHVALVDSAANLQEVLVMKNSKEVAVELSMKNFLKKFFGLWEEDAAVLAGVLGYSPDVYNDEVKENGEWMSTSEYIESKISAVTLLKGKSLEGLDALPEKIHSIVSDLQKGYEGALDEASVISEDKPNEELSSDINKNKEVSMELTKEQIEDLQKQADKASKMQEELDTLKAHLADIEKAKAEKAKADMTDLVKGFSFVVEEDKEELVDTLLKSESGILVDILEKAQKAILAATTVEVGDEGEDLTKSDTSDDVLGKVNDILKARKNK